jgi:arylsulfatase A-like enzyme
VTGRWPWLGLVLLAGLAACGEVETPPPRNVLIIAVDTLRADRLGGYGYERNTSPRLDSLMRQSVIFDDAWSASSWTLPSFASLFTSLHTSTHGCWDFKSKLDDSHTTLAEILADRGFATAAVVSHVFMRPSYGLSQGFADYDHGLAREMKISHRSVSSPAVSDRAIRWLRDRKERGDDRPFLLWAHYFDPHHHYMEHEGVSLEFGTDTESNLYDGEIAFTDGHIDRLLTELDRQGLTDETVIVLVADHGEEFGEHGATRHGNNLHVETTRIPFTVRVPGVEPGYIAGDVSGVDLLPTLLDLLEVPLPAGVPLAGRSLEPIIRGETMSDQGAVSELRLYEDKQYDAIVLGRWRLIVGRSGDEPEYQLYDRRADPGERQDLSVDRPDVVKKLTELLDVQLEAARAVAGFFDEPEDLDLSEEDLERLRELGYVR